MMKRFLASTLGAVAIAATLLIPSQASAGLVSVTYLVDNVDTGGNSHVLWTSRTKYGGSPYFSVDASNLLTLEVVYDDADPFNGSGYARLQGRAISNSGNGSYAEFDVAFTDMDDALAGGPSKFKNGGGLGYRPGVAPNGQTDITQVGSDQVQDFFADVAANGGFQSKIEIFTSGGSLIDSIDVSDFEDVFNSFQFGWGANDKDSGFGASAWIEDESNETVTAFGDGLASNRTSTSNHWDLNLKLREPTLPTTGTFLPEPTSAMVFSMVALTAIPFRRRRK